MVCVVEPVAVEVDAEGRFLFENVIPGLYRIKVNAADRCFAQEEIKVQLKNSDIADVSFTQIGYPVEINMDRDVEVTVQPEGAESDGKVSSLTKVPYLTHLPSSPLPLPYLSFLFRATLCVYFLGK